jgi:hypothetical protein
VKQSGCDVLVVGGGVAGTLAAVAAARGGVRTLLVEKGPCLGGIGYAGMFQQICGLYLNGGAFPVQTLNAGIVREVVDRLYKISPEKKVQKIGRVFVLPYDREVLRSTLAALCAAEQNLEVLYNCVAASITARNGQIEHVVLNRPEEEQGLQPAAVIDCSGDGAAAALAGAEYYFATTLERQLAGFTLHVKGLKAPDEVLAIKVPYYLAQAVKEGRFASPLQFTTFSLGNADDEGYCKISVADHDGSGREEKVRKDAEAIHCYLSSILPAFKGSFIMETSPYILEREGRRVKGEYTLTEEDVLSGRKFEDGIAKNSWPIELWDSKMGPIYRYLQPDEYYDIPFRCLLVKGITNLLTAGRCISVSHEALGSTRVMGTCMALGEQAGRAAAHRVKHGRYPEKAEPKSRN